MKKTLFLAFCMVLCQNIAFGLTKSQLISEIRNMVRDNNSDSTKLRWSSTTIVERINMGQQDIASKTRCMQGIEFIDTYENQEGYALPSDLIVTNRVAYTTITTSTTIVFSTNSFKTLDRVSVLGMDNLVNLYWEQLSGQPLRYYIVGSSICINPRPSATWAGSSRLKLIYSQTPYDLVLDTDIPFRNYAYLYQYHYLLIYYVAMMCKLDENDTQAFQFYSNLYLQGLSLMVSELQSKPDFIPSFSFGGYGK